MDIFLFKFTRTLSIPGPGTSSFRGFISNCYLSHVRIDSIASIENSVKNYTHNLIFQQKDSDSEQELYYALKH